MPDIFQDLTSAFRAAGGLLIPGIALKSLDVQLVNNDTYTPDLRQAMEHNITLSAGAAAVTIANPIIGASFAGWMNLLITHVRNGSGGATTITWGSKFKQAAFSQPADGSGVITLWHYDRTLDLWFSSARTTVVNS